MLETLLQHPDHIVHGEAVKGGLDTPSQKPGVFHFFTETLRKLILHLVLDFISCLRPQSFPNIIQRGELYLAGVNETEILLKRPMVHAGHLDNCHRMTVD